MDALQLYNFKPAQKKKVYTLPQNKQKVIPVQDSTQKKVTYICYSCFAEVNLNSVNPDSCHCCGSRIVYKPNQNKSLIYNAI